MTSDSEEKRPASETEAWLCGPLPDGCTILTPAAHALLQASIDTTNFEKVKLLVSRDLDDKVVAWFRVFFDRHKI